MFSIYFSVVYDFFENFSCALTKLKYDSSHTLFSLKPGFLKIKQTLQIFETWKIGYTILQMFHLYGT